MNYYVFQYSTGIIASLALSDRWLKGDKQAQAGYLEVLKAGGSDYPLAILKKAGVDMTRPEPYVSGAEALRPAGRRDGKDRRPAAEAEEILTLPP